MDHTKLPSSYATNCLLLPHSPPVTLSTIASHRWHDFGKKAEKAIASIYLTRIHRTRPLHLCSSQLGNYSEAQVPPKGEYIGSPSTPSVSRMSKAGKKRGRRSASLDQQVAK